MVMVQNIYSIWNGDSTHVINIILSWNRNIEIINFTLLNLIRDLKF